MFLTFKFVRVLIECLDFFNKLVVLKKIKKSVLISGVISVLVLLFHFILNVLESFYYLLLINIQFTVLQLFISCNLFIF